MVSKPAISEVELLVLNWLVKRQIHFIPQVNMFGGTTEAGGAKVDFILTESNIIIRVMSYYHTLEPSRTRDILQKEALMNEGYTVVDVWEKDIRENIGRVMSMALQGEELHRDGV